MNTRRPRLPLLASFRTSIPAGLFGLIVIAATPLGPLQPLAERVWPALSLLGIDVAMTPLTFDMMLMHDPRSGQSFYQYPVEVVYRTPQGDVTVPPASLPLYRWRIPAILFFEEFHWGADTRAHRYALCHELQRLYGPGTAFQVRLGFEGQSVESFGLNRFHACP